MRKYLRFQSEYIIAGLVIIYTFFAENVMLDSPEKHVLYGGGVR